MCILYRCIFYVSVYIHIHTDRMLLFGNLTEGCTSLITFYKSEIIFKNCKHFLIQQTLFVRFLTNT